ncbi:MAG: beta-N-acetylhexosaminidase [Thermoleophilaceae bacterium]|nr:beta-N-acetylhexosaminidase [Thermoleophilaceae bacterium]
MAVKDSFPVVRGPRRKRILIRQLTAVLVFAVVVGGTIVFIRSRTSGNEAGTTLQLPAASGDGNGPASHVSFLERLIPPPPERVSGPAAPRSLADLARRLPLERAVAQLFLFGFTGKDATAPIFPELRRLDVGGLVLDGGNYDAAQQLAGLASQLTAAAANARHLPPWIMAEQDGGDYSQFPDLPPPQPPGAYKTPADAAAAFTSAATTLKALGFNGLLEPDLDLAASSDVGSNALGQRALSDSPDVVANYARRTIAACRQLQILCAPKHFPGIGAADTTTDEAAAQIGLPLSQLIQRDVVPFTAAIKAKATAIVVGEGLYEPDSFVTPAALSSKIIGGLLRKRLRFGGLALTDDLSDPGVSSLVQIPDAAVQAIKAGADMVYISGDMSDQEAAYAAVLNAVRSGEISEKRIRQSLLRVLVAKGGYNLLVTKPQSKG